METVTVERFVKYFKQTNFKKIHLVSQVEELDPRKDEERRALLREVEVRVMQYQDELESGRKSVKAGWTVAEQVAKDLHFCFEFIPSLTKLGGALPSQGDEEDSRGAGNAKKGAQSKRKS